MVEYFSIQMNIGGDEGLKHLLGTLFALLKLYFLLHLLPNERGKVNRNNQKPFWVTTEDDEFRICFRLDRTQFRKLLYRIQVDLIGDESQASMRNGVIEPEVRLAIVMRILAGGS